MSGSANGLPGLGTVMVASGCGGTGRELAPYADLDGLTFVTRSLTLDPRPGGPSPRIAESPSGLVNAIGLHNPGLENFLAVELPWLVRAGAASWCRWRVAAWPSTPTWPGGSPGPPAWRGSRST